MPVLYTQGSSRKSIPLEGGPCEGYSNNQSSSRSAVRSTERGMILQQAVEASRQLLENLASEQSIILQSLCAAQQQIQDPKQVLDCASEIRHKSLS